MCGLLKIELEVYELRESALVVRVEPIYLLEDLIEPVVVLKVRILSVPANFRNESLAKKQYPDVVQENLLFAGNFLQMV